MSAQFSQDDRLAKLHTDLGKDELVVRRFSGEEKMNGMFEFRVDALSTSADINFDDLLGTHASIEIKTIAHDVRFFDGIVTMAKWAGPGSTGYHYELLLRPWIWLMSKRRQQRIFHDKTGPQIIEEVLSSYGSIGHYSLSGLRNSYETLEYTVQYGESDLNFLLRLMERFGINYHFDFDMSVHKLVLTDNTDDLPEIPGGLREFFANDTKVHGNDEHFWNWQPERNFTTGAMRLIDYNFKAPDSKMEVDRIGTSEYAEGQLEGYDFPGDYLNEGVGKKVATLRMDQELNQHNRHRAVGDCLSLSAGMRVSVKGEHTAEVNGKGFVCLAASHFYESDSYGSGDGSGQGTSYTGSYVLTSDAAPVVPTRNTKPPVIPGPQTAVVVGDGEIDCDDYGRVKVHFHWDLEKANSMWVRSSQTWAHKGWGGVVIPRIGMEVIVEFINGDPDQPLITGHVYNGKNMPPYELPANKTRSSFKTKSHQTDGFNELRFEDQGGEEEIFTHAQKDETLKVLNHSTARIDKNEVRSVGKNRFVEVAIDETQHIGGNLTVSVTGSKSETYATGDLGENWEGIRSLGYSLDHPGGPGGSYQMTAAKNITMTSGEHTTFTTGKERSETVGENMSLSVGKDRTISISGEHRESIGKTMFVQAADEIMFKCGKSTLSLKKDGTIVIKGKDITVDGSGKINQKAASSITMKASKINMN